MGRVQPDHLPDLAAPLPGGVHHDLGLDRAFVGDHIVDAAVLQVDLLHICVRKNACPTLLGAGSQGIGQAGRIDHTIVGGISCAGDPIRVHDREEVHGFLGRDQVHRHAEGLRHANQPLEVFHAFGGRSQPQAADLAPGGIVAGLVLQFPVQVGAVVHHPGQVGIRTHLPDQAGRVPGRAAGQLVAFQDDDIFPPHER